MTSPYPTLDHEPWDEAPAPGHLANMHILPISMGGAGLDANVRDAIASLKSSSTRVAVR